MILARARIHLAGTCTRITGRRAAPSILEGTVGMSQIDTEKFRLRRFVEKLVQEGECVVYDDPIDLVDVASVLDCNPNAVWFRRSGQRMARRQRDGYPAPARCRARYRRGRLSRDAARELQTSAGADCRAPRRLRCRRWC